VVLRDAKAQFGDLLNSLVDAAPVDSPAALVSAIDADAAGQVSDAITASLKANGWPPSKWRSHLLCSALAATAHAMDAAEDKAKELIVQEVTTALTSAGVPGPVAGMAAHATLDAITKLPAYKQWDAVRRGVRLSAIAACPAAENHPEVVNYCVLPLASNYLPDAIQRELFELPVNVSTAAS
jgi:hypothetical protein